ncbi:MAG: chemotaxis protein CheW [Gammaproteobacteria bacterium]
MINTGEVVRSLFIPLAGDNLVLPNAAVAEVVAYSTPDAVTNAPDWLLGKISWRNQTIPLISFEAAAGGPIPTPAARSRITIFNGITGNPKLRFYALLTQDIPHLMKIDASVIAAGSGGQTTTTALANVMVNGEAAHIPNLDALETLLQKVV